MAKVNETGLRWYKINKKDLRGTKSTKRDEVEQNQQYQQNGTSMV